VQANDALIQDQYGQASFNNLQTFLQGAISTYTFASASTPLSWRSLEGAFYAEDAIKLTPSLELSLGFREESPMAGTRRTAAPQIIYLQME